MLESARSMRNVLAEHAPQGFLMKRAENGELVRADLLAALRANASAQFVAAGAAEAPDAETRSRLLEHTQAIVESIDQVADEERAQPVILVGVSDGIDAPTGAVRLRASGRASFAPKSPGTWQHHQAMLSVAAALGLEVPSDLQILAAELFYRNGELVDYRFMGMHGAEPTSDGTVKVRAWGTPEQPALRVFDDHIAPAVKDLGRTQYAVSFAPTAEGELGYSVYWNLAENLPSGPTGDAEPTPEGDERIVGIPVLQAIQRLWGEVEMVAGPLTGATAHEPLWRAMQAMASTVLQDEKTPLKGGTALRAVGAAVPSESVVFFGDINRFKRLNDEAGHDAGDAAIAKVGDVLHRICAPFRTTAFRQSGDEFVVLAPARHAEALAADLREAFTRVELDYNGESHEVAMSFGWTDVVEAEALSSSLKRAEVACQAAKAEGDGAVLRWTEAMGFRKTDARRFRCAECSTTFNVDVSLDDPPDSISCPVCGRLAS